MRLVAKQKNKFYLAVVCICIGILVFGVWQNLLASPSQMSTPDTRNNPIISGAFDPHLIHSESEWQEVLTPEQFYILRKAGTERPFSGELNNEKRSGTYYSAGCDEPLFRSEQKYDSQTGWPSFWAPVDDKNVVLKKETEIGDDRIEVLDTCGNHLGHVFDDGPEPTGKRYCMNSDALRFVPDEETKE